ncbi:MAG: cation:proton antiporter [Bacteroidetes bacterium]|nr:cation:proton antiporter [Bacteroidota bacterium]
MIPFLASVEIPLLDDVLIIIGLSVLVVLAFHRFKMPPIVAYLVTGVLAGPSVLKFVEADANVEMLAELGVILLMFTIGLEFSLSSLLRIWRSVFIMGGLQVGLAVLVTALVAAQMDLPWEQSVFLGFLVSLSSTAIVLKVLQQNMQLDSLHGRNILAILIFQDIIVVPMMLMAPILAGQSDDIGSTVLWLVLKVLAVLVFVAVASRYLMPRLLYLVARTRSRELFILSMVVICFAVAWATAQLGLSLALGAFLAGLIISESEYSYQATSDIMPFREIFASFFFVSVGMLVDVDFFLAHPLTIILVALGVLVVKAVLVGIAALSFRLPARTVILIGLSLAQVGEFSFILSKTGMQFQLLGEELYQYFLSVSTLTMALTPFIILGGQRISSFIMKAPLPVSLRQHLRSRLRTEGDDAEATEALSDHLVIIGYGLNGQNLAKVARKAQIPYIVAETNPDTVRYFQGLGEPILYGDASMEHILEHLHVQSARVAVVAISDPQATRQIVAALRHMAPSLHILVRTRYVKQVADLLAAGASDVVPEEFETSIEIFSRVLNRYLVPQEEIVAFGKKVRDSSYSLLRGESLVLPEDSPQQQARSKVEVSTLVVPDGSWLARRNLADLALRQQYGLNLVAIRRNKILLEDVSGDTVIHPLDELYVFGKPDNIQAFCQALRV